MRIYPALENEVTDPAPGDAPVAAAVVHPDSATDLVVATPEAVEQVAPVFESTQRAALEASVEMDLALRRALQAPQLNAQDVRPMRVALEQFCRVIGYTLPPRAALEADQTQTPQEELRETVSGLDQTFKKIRAQLKD